MVAAIIIVLAIPLSVLAFKYYSNSGNSQPPFTEITFPTNNNSEFDLAEQNPQNTIVTVGPDSTRYRLVMIGDQPPRFYINDTIIPVHLWDQHMLLINQLKKQLKEVSK